MLVLPVIISHLRRNDRFESKSFESVLNNCLRCLADVSVAPVLASNPIAEIDVLVDQGISTDPNEFIGTSQLQSVSRKTQCSFVLNAFFGITVCPWPPSWRQISKPTPRFAPVTKAIRSFAMLIFSFALFGMNAFEAPSPTAS